MKYSYEFKVECVGLYRNGIWKETPTGIKPENFHKLIRSWARMTEANGLESLHHKPQNRKWTTEEKYALVAKVIAGQSCQSVAIEAGINKGMLHQWVRKYKERGYNGLVNQKRGKPSKEPNMKKEVNPPPLSESEREELIRLRGEVEYLRTEIAVRKKLMALRREKEAAQLKAKRQHSSKNSEKKASG